MRFALINGKLLPEDAPAIPVNDRGFLFGDGVFTTVKINNGVIEFWQAHLERLKQQCIALQIIYPQIEFESIKELLHVNNAFKGLWRLKIIITGGVSKKQAMENRPAGNLVMTLQPYENCSQQSFRLTTYPHIIAGPLAHVKTLSYLNRLFVSEYAEQAGYDDAVVLTSNGLITETAFSNLFLKKGDIIYSPDPSIGLLQGITIHYVQKAAQKIGLEWNLSEISLLDILDGQLFVCNAMKGIQLVDSLGENKFARDVEFENRLSIAFEEMKQEHSLSANQS